MAEVTIRPMPQRYRKISKKFRPQHPPIFTHGEGETEPTPGDIKLARALFKVLDRDSQEWYQHPGGIFDGLGNKKTKGKRSKAGLFPPDGGTSGKGKGIPH